MLEKIKRWKFEFADDTEDVVLLVDGGIVKDIITKNEHFEPFLVKFNIYGVVRYLFQFFPIEAVYRLKNNNWTRLNTDKIKTLAEAPLKECI